MRRAKMAAIVWACRLKFHLYETRSRRIGFSPKLADVKGIEIVEANKADANAGYDVLVLNELEEAGAGSGYNSPSPSSGIVMVGPGGKKASVFSRMQGDVRLEPSTKIALEKAIHIAAGES